MITMLLGGLWHGAAWTFVVWGGLHGFYLGVERFLQRRFGGAKIATTFGFKVFLGLLTYFLVNLTWVFFRAPDFPTAWSMTRTMLGFGVEGSELVLTTYLVAVVVAVTIGILVVHGFMRNRRLEQVVANAPWWLVGSVWAAMLFLILISQGSGNAFIYFQF
jgi:alginate O-acetyltransferase complex protein AlgI